MELSVRKPKVTVCVVTYNQEKYIRQCLQSLVEQATQFPFEIIVGDDCSSDSTPMIVKEFADKYPKIIVPVFLEINTGGTKNYLQMHNSANGEYVAHMDGDDYALPGKLQAQADILDADPMCTAVWHRVDYFNDAGEFCSGETANLSIFSNGRVSFSEAIRLGFVGVHSSLMYRRTAREAIPSDAEVIDLYLTWNLLSKGTGYIINEVLGRYRVSAIGSLTVSSLPRIRRLSIAHAKHFLKVHSEQRKNFFIWAVSNVLVELKKLRMTMFDFSRFALMCVSLVKPSDIYRNLVNMKKTQVKWSCRLDADSKVSTEEN